MTEQVEEVEFTASIMMRPLGSTPEPRQLVLGSEPCILIEPKPVEDRVIFSFDSTGLDKDSAILVLEALVQTLKETELNRVEEG